MYVAQLSVTTGERADEEAVSALVDRLLGALRMNGQICGDEMPVTRGEETWSAYVLLPDSDSLDPHHASPYVANALSEISAAGWGQPVVTLVGEEAYYSEPCRCTTHASYILYTNYVDAAPPLRCGTCFDYVPLYTIPPTKDQEYHDVMAWLSDYRACDRLQMDCRTLERAATREMSRADSSLSKRGRAICDKVTASTGIPTYYYLYRYTATTMKQERARKCPSCAGEWLLEEPEHIFDFRCDRCRLVSSISFDVR